MVVKEKERVIVGPDWDWRTLTARDIAGLALGALLLLNFVWLVWSQADQNHQLADMRAQIDSQTQTVNSMNDSLKQYIQNMAAQSAAQASRAAQTPLPVTIPGGGTTGTGSNAGGVGGTGTGITGSPSSGIGGSTGGVSGMGGTSGTGGIGTGSGAAGSMSSGTGSATGMGMGGMGTGATGTGAAGTGGTGAGH